MKLALVGYGKMGKAIEAIAINRGHEIILKISSQNKADLTSNHLQNVDVVIEFTSPESALENVAICLEAGIPVVCGSTGWAQNLHIAHDACKQANTAFLWASNFSVGVNIFFELNKKLAQLMKGIHGYNVIVEETHHTQKKDAPSGTGITIAEQIIDNYPSKSKWVSGNAQDDTELSIVSHRIEDVPGTHLVKYSSAIDDLEISHTAHSRDGFALGAVLAAEFLKDKQGIYSMKDVLQIG